MAKIVGLPKLSPTMEEGTLARWAIEEGARFEVDDLIAEVETDKATMEWRAFDPGVLLKRLVDEGTELAPDAPVAIIGEEGEDISELLAELEGGGAKPSKPTPEAEEPAATDDEAEESEDEESEDEESEDEPRDGDEPSRDEPSGKSPAGRRGPHGAQPSGRILASPLVRRLAREHEVDLAALEGSGPGGRIIKRDLDAFLADPQGAKRADRDARREGERPEPRREKLSSMRRTIARRLLESKQTVPHFYLTIDIDAGPLAEARAAMNEALADDGEKVSVNDLILKACALALREVPEVNASFDGDAILHHQVVDLSVAVAIEGGLLTPVVRDADRKGVRAIAREVRELAARARDKKLAPEEMQGGTFSVSNLGMFGIEEFSAVINPPEGAILAVGTTREVPVVVDGGFEIGQRMRLTMSCDHRVIDGALGAKWLAALRRLLERPVLMAL